MTDDPDKRARAKLTAAIDTMIQALKAASQASHELQDDDPDFTRVVELGYLTTFAGEMCAADLMVLNAIAIRLLDNHEGVEQTEATQQQAVH